ncbi:MAG: hypothetical protein ING19_02855 [Azospirillum sp.]|nr:hypothetical protein [Azospirillum sp.]
MTIFDTEFDLQGSWEAASRKRAWLSAHETELRELAAKNGWAAVAEALESRGWSIAWGTRPLTGEWLSREMAVVAYRARRAVERRQRRVGVEISAGILPIRGGRPTPRRFLEAIAGAVADVVEKKIDQLAARGAELPPAAERTGKVPAQAPAKPLSGDVEIDRALGGLATPVAPAVQSRLRQIPAKTPTPSRVILSPADGAATDESMPASLLRKDHENDDR